MKDDVQKAIQTIQDNLCTGEAKGRHIVVLDRGWIFVGNLTKLDDDGYMLSDCYNIRKWQSGGFGGLTQGATTAQATLDSSRPIKFRSRAMLFCVPVSEDWS